MFLADGTDVQLFGVSDYMDSPLVKTYITVRSVLSPLLIGGAAYHGYKRSDGSLMWAVGWAALAALFPTITTGVAIAQGYGKEA